MTEKIQDTRSDRKMDFRKIQRDWSDSVHKLVIEMVCRKTFVNNAINNKEGQQTYVH